ncbi:hypothetical protein AB1L30_17600 [Bremerella sp. JC817]|uniref:hypothetical protein n=1 Tax=Bremerella sp. JC817 TaxID=3231756 RepID=UPI00345897C0
MKNLIDPGDTKHFCDLAAEIAEDHLSLLVLKLLVEHQQRLERFCVWVQAAADEGSDILQVNDDLPRRSRVGASEDFLDGICCQQLIGGR